MINLEPKHLTELKSILAKYDYSFYLFGSRITQNVKKFSDIDLLFFENISSTDLINLEDDLEESNLPFTVDLVNYNKCTESFKKIIGADFVPLQTKKFLVIPHLILEQDNQLFFSRRVPTQKLWANHWHLVTGTIEMGETALDAIIRETKEEINLTLETKPELVQIVAMEQPDILNKSGTFKSLEFFFKIGIPSSTSPINMEPTKQDAIGFFPKDNLPNPMIKGVEFAVKNHLNDPSSLFAEFKF